MPLTRPASFVPHQLVLATQLNELVANDQYEYDYSRGLGYTPTWTTSGTAPALGNGTLTGMFGRYGRYVDFKLFFVAGSTTTFGTGRFQFALPVTAADTNEVFAALLVDVGAQYYSATGLLYSTGVMGVTFTGDVSAGQIDATHPFTWATSDQIRVTGRYLAAAD